MLKVFLNLGDNFYLFSKWLVERSEASEET